MGITAGILLILTSIAHNIYGEKIQIPALKKHTTDSIQVGCFDQLLYSLVYRHFPSQGYHKNYCSSICLFIVIISLQLLSL
jgi:hypothetical protein